MKVIGRYASFAAFSVIFGLANLIVVHHIYISKHTSADVFDSRSLLLASFQAPSIQSDYPCFPPRRSQPLGDENPTNVVYLETAYTNLHYETYYSFIHQLCSCGVAGKDDRWTIDSNAIPHFYVGPREYLTPGFERILREYNTTTCGPIFFGTPESPNLTIVTTAYESNFRGNPKVRRRYGKYHRPGKWLLNDPRYIFICHDDAPSLENASNVFFLTPRHERCIVPSFFPPSIVKRYSRSLRYVGRPPMFLVLGGFDDRYRRNIESLKYPLEANRHRNFTVRFLGGSSSGNVTREELHERLRAAFPDDYDKIELLPKLDADEFMLRVSEEADVILPLVDETNFHSHPGYSGGKKLTSSLMWAMGFGKKMVLYRSLAEVFGIEKDGERHYLHGNSTSEVGTTFGEAFTRCLVHLLDVG